LWLLSLLKIADKQKKDIDALASAGLLQAPRQGISGANP